jgi:glycosyltransferase involved in cell wall biosynthesis
LGQALRYAFANCQGDYIVTLDLDLSYSPDHVKQMLDAIMQTRAKIIIASPYMKGGRVSNVPWLRKILSIWANKFLSLTAKGKISTVTGMVRAYDRKFIQALNTKAMDMGINPEIIYKAQLLRARIIEIPAHLDWSFQKDLDTKRSSSMKILWNILSSLFAGFIFRPFMFFIIPGFFLLLLAFYPIIWTFIHTLSYFSQISSSGASFDSRLSEAIASAFSQAPHTFIVGGIALVIGLQLVSLGIISLQNKRYFEELFHLGSTAVRVNRQDIDF